MSCPVVYADPDGFTHECIWDEGHEGMHECVCHRMWDNVTRIKVYVHVHHDIDESFVWGVYADVNDALAVATSCQPYSDGVWLGRNDEVRAFDVAECAESNQSACMTCHGTGVRLDFCQHHCPDCTQRQPPNPQQEANP